MPLTYGNILFHQNKLFLKQQKIQHLTIKEKKFVLKNFYVELKKI